MLYSSAEGVQRRPISFGPIPGCHSHLESSPAPTTNLGCLPLIPSILPISHTPPLGVPLGNSSLHLPYTHQLVHGRTAPHQPQHWWGPQVKFSLFILSLQRAMWRGVGRAALWYGLVAPLASPLGPLPPLVPTLGWDAGV